MKTPKKTANKPSADKAKKAAPGGKTRKMEPLKSKELKNQKFDELEEDDEQIDPEMMDDNFKGFDDVYDEDEDDI